MTSARPPGRPPHPDVLTPAEWRVAEGVRHGSTNKAIAARLGISADAVKFHVGNALSKLGFASRQELRRWNGVSMNSNLFQNGSTRDESTDLGPLGQVARSVSDIALAERWYREVLGLPHLYSFGLLAFFDCGGVRLMLSEGEGMADSILYFSTRDIRAAHAALLRKKVEFISAPHCIHRHEDGTEEWMAFFNDLDGRPLALMAQAVAQRSSKEE